jgi:hypothetical protein
MTEKLLTPRKLIAACDKALVKSVREIAKSITKTECPQCGENLFIVEIQECAMCGRV